MCITTHTRHTTHEGIILIESKTAGIYILSRTGSTRFYQHHYIGYSDCDPPLSLCVRLTDRWTERWSREIFRSARDHATQNAPPTTIAPQFTINRKHYHTITPTSDHIHNLLVPRFASRSSLIAASTFLVFRACKSSSRRSAPPLCSSCC